MHYTYKFHIGEEGENMIGEVSSDYPLPDLTVGTELMLTVPGWGQRIGDRVMIKRTRITISDMPTVKRYQLDVFCEIEHY